MEEKAILLAKVSPNHASLNKELNYIRTCFY